MSAHDFRVEYHDHAPDSEGRRFYPLTWRDGARAEMKRPTPSFVGPMSDTFGQCFNSTQWARYDGAQHGAEVRA